MKLLLFFLLLIATLYAAAMYQYPLLLLLCLIEGILIVVLFGITVYIKRHITLETVTQRGTVEKGEVYWYENNIRSESRFPVGRLRLKLYCGYWQRPNFEKSAGLYGSSDRDSGEFRFSIAPPYCGLFWASLEKLTVYDYLSLFSLSKPVEQSLLLAVFPKKRPLQMVIADWEQEKAWQSSLPPEYPWQRPENTYGEIRQIREYQEGDSLRHIHWNQSARTDTLWVREYEKEQETEWLAAVLLEPEPAEKLSFGRELLEKMDAFYELTYALLLGLLEKADCLWVYWYEEEAEELTEMKAVNEEDCREILLKLYQSRFLIREEKMETAKQALSLPYSGKSGKKLFRLTLGLAWYHENTLIHQFSREKMEEQITKQIYRV